MFWPFKKKDKDAEAISVMHGVPEGFFRCAKCKVVRPDTKYGGSLWEGGRTRYLCKNCMDIGIKDPIAPERLIAKKGEKPRSIKRY